MGEGADRLKNGSGKPEDIVGRVAGEIDTLRSELGGLVAELDRRRIEAFDLGLQAKKHPLLVAIVATSAALVLGGALAVVVRGRRRRRRPAVKARQARSALARLLEHPDRVAVEPSITNKVATAVAVALATTLVKRLLERSIAPAPATRARVRAAPEERVAVRRA